MRCDDFYAKWKRCGNFCEKNPSTAARIEAYLDQIEEMTHVLKESSEEGIRQDIIAPDTSTMVCSIKEPLTELPENTPMGNFSERSIRPLIKEKDDDIRQEAIRQSGRLIEAKKRKFGKAKSNVTAKEMESIIEEIKDSRPHVVHNSGDNEWYTPQDYIDAAVKTMGHIDLDPASTPLANTIVGARTIFTDEQNGIEQEWFGSVWLNPPYESKLIKAFITKLCESYDSGNVKQACVLVNNATETAWFQRMCKSASVIVFPTKRVRFWHPSDKISAPLQGQAVLYLGDNGDKFIEAFSSFGVICNVV